MPTPRPAPKRQRAQRFLASPRVLLVGRVGIEPTTNGLRVQGTRAGAGRKPKNSNDRFARERTAAPRPNLCRTKSRRRWLRAAFFKPCQRLSAAATEPFPNVRRVGAAYHQQALRTRAKCTPRRRPGPLADPLQPVAVLDSRRSENEAGRNVVRATRAPGPLERSVRASTATKPLHGTRTHGAYGALQLQLEASLRSPAPLKRATCG